MPKNRHLNWVRGVKYVSNYTLFISGLLYFTSRILKLNTLAQLHFQCQKLFHFSEIHLDFKVIILQLIVKSFH